jgi:hypothetical protein
LTGIKRMLKSTKVEGKYSLGREGSILPETLDLL